MSTEETEGAKALGRIQEAERTRSDQLDLSDLVFLERLPHELNRLSSLQTLDISGCRRLNDISPLAGLTSLQSLKFFGSKEVCGSDLSPLAGLVSLQTLKLSMCMQLRDIFPLVGLTSLRTLQLYECEQLSGDLSPLAGLTLLQTLCLTFGGQLSGDLTPLAGLTSLKWLNLQGCKQLSGGLTPLAGLTSLQKLKLRECEQLSGDLSPLAGLTSLQELCVTDCEQLRGDLTPLAGLTSLQGQYERNWIKWKQEDLERLQDDFRWPYLNMICIGNRQTSKNAVLVYDEGTYILVPDVHPNHPFTIPTDARRGAGREFLEVLIKEDWYPN
jgi:Leucine-rich repeat (LRR) protein